MTAIEGLFACSLLTLSSLSRCCNGTLCEKTVDGCGARGVRGQRPRLLQWSNELEARKNSRLGDIV